MRVLHSVQLEVPSSVCRVQDSEFFMNVSMMNFLFKAALISSMRSGATVLEENFHLHETAIKIDN